MQDIPKPSQKNGKTKEKPDLRQGNYDANDMEAAEYWESKYRELEAENKEQSKTVTFQKAKIAALQTELEETL